MTTLLSAGGIACATFSCGVCRPVGMSNSYDRNVAVVGAALGEEAFAAVRAEGREVISADAVAYA